MNDHHQAWANAYFLGSRGPAVLDDFTSSYGYKFSDPGKFRSFSSSIGVRIHNVVVCTNFMSCSSMLWQRQTADPDSPTAGYQWGNVQGGTD